MAALFRRRTFATYRGYLGTTRDVSEQWASEAQLRQAQWLLKVAAHAGGLGAWSIELPSLKLTWSDEIRQIHEMPPGYTPSYAQALDFYAPESARRIASATRACLLHGTPFDLELELITARTRRVLWVRIIGTAEHDAGGAITSVQGAFQDVTILKTAAESARLSAERLTRVLESLPDGFIIVEPGGTFIYINAAAERILRRPRGDLLGLSLWGEFPGGETSRFFTEFRKVRHEGQTVEFEEYSEPLGIWLDVKAYPSEQGMTIWFRDDSERITARQEILQLNAELEERVLHRTAELEASNKEFEAFSYSIAHDLRQPLSALAGFSHLVMSHEKNISDKGRHWLLRIRNAAKQMDKMTEALLSLARLSRVPLKLQPVDLAQLAREAAAALADHHPQRRVELTVDELPMVEGDPALLGQVMANLLGNAWKFTAGQDVARIQVGCFKGLNGEDVFFVKDSGVGFDMGHAKSLFRVFHRLHAPHEFEGTGIGLATVHKIVGSHGGRIWAQAEPGLGATFFFTIGKAVTGFGSLTSPAPL